MKNVIKKLLEKFSHEIGYRHATVVYGGKPSIVFNNIGIWRGNQTTGDLVKMVDKIPYYKSPMTRINAALRLVHQDVFRWYQNQDHRTKVCERMRKRSQKLYGGINNLIQQKCMPIHSTASMACIDRYICGHDVS